MVHSGLEAGASLEMGLGVPGQVSGALWGPVDSRGHRTRPYQRGPSLLEGVLQSGPRRGGGRRELGQQRCHVLGPQHHHISPDLAVAVLGGCSGPGSVPGAPAPPDPGPQATPSPSRPHGATGTWGVGGPDLGRPETASRSVPGPQEGVLCGDSGGWSAPRGPRPIPLSL